MSSMLAEILSDAPSAPREASREPSPARALASDEERDDLMTGEAQSASERDERSLLTAPREDGEDHSASERDERSFLSASREDNFSPLVGDGLFFLDTDLELDLGLVGDAERSDVSRSPKVLSSVLSHTGARTFQARGEDDGESKESPKRLRTGSPDESIGQTLSSPSRGLRGARRVASVRDGAHLSDVERAYISMREESRPSDSIVESAPSVSPSTQGNLPPLFPALMAATAPALAAPPLPPAALAPDLVAPPLPPALAAPPLPPAALAAGLAAACLAAEVHNFIKRSARTGTAGQFSPDEAVRAAKTNSHIRQTSTRAEREEMGEAIRSAVQRRRRDVGDESSVNACHLIVRTIANTLRMKLDEVTVLQAVVYGVHRDGMRSRLVPLISFGAGMPITSHPAWKTFNTETNVVILESISCDIFSGTRYKIAGTLTTKLRAVQEHFDIVEEMPAPSAFA